MSVDLSNLELRVNAGPGIAELDRYDAAVHRSEQGSALLKDALLSLGIAFSAGAAFRKFIEETSAAQAAQAQLEAAVRSTGGAAGRSVVQLQELASQLQQVSTFSDEAVQAAQSVLLTFTKIRGDQFDDATRAVVDLATRMGGDLKGAALQLGKALQDPEQGLTALTRSGVSFSDAEKDVIKHLNDTGHAAEAQRLILAELSKEFGGSAAAARDTLGGALTGLSNQFGELFEASKGSTRPAIDAVNDLSEALRQLKQAMDDADVFAKLISGAANVIAIFLELNRVIDIVIAGITGGLVVAFGYLQDSTAEMKRGLDLLKQAGEGIAHIGDNLRGAAAAAGAGSTKGVIDLIEAERQRARALGESDAAVGKLDKSYQKAIETARVAVDRQQALNVASGASAAAIRDLNDAFDHKNRLAAIDAQDLLPKQIAALKAFEDALYAATKAGNVLSDAQEAINRGAVEMATAAGRAVEETNSAINRVNQGITAQANARLHLLDDTGDLEKQNRALADLADGLAKSTHAYEARILQQRQSLALSKAEAEAAVYHLTLSDAQRDRIKAAIADNEHLTQVLQALKNAQDIGGLENTFKIPVKETEDWESQLTKVLGVAQLIGSALGAAGNEFAKAIAQAATGAQSIVSGLDAARNATSFADKAAAAGQIVGGGIAIVTAYSDHLREAQEAATQAARAQIEYTRSLRDFAITARTSEEAALKQNADQATQILQSRGVYTPVDDSNDLQEIINKYLGTDGIIGRGLKALIPSLEALREEMAANEATIHARVAAEIADRNEALDVLDLRNAGRTAEADALQAATAAANAYRDSLAKYGDIVLAGRERTAILAAYQKQLNDANAEAARQAQAELQRVTRSVFDTTTATQAFTDPRGASQAAFEEELRRRFADASTAAEKAAVALRNLAEASDRAAQIAAKDLSDARSATARILAASGDTRGADDLNRLNAQTEQLAAAIREGMAPSNLALLQQAQFAESSQVQMQRAIEDGTTLLNAEAQRQTAVLDEQAKTLRADAAEAAHHAEMAIDAAKAKAAADARYYDDAIGAARDSVKATLAALDQQGEYFRRAQATAQDQLQAAQQNVAATQRVVDSLGQFAQSLKLSDLSTLSPTAKLAEARAQFEALAAQAFGGNRDAAGGIPAAITAFLQQLRVVEASGVGYASGEARAQDVLAALQEKFGAQLGTENSALGQAQSAVAQAEAQLAALQATRDAVSASGDAQVAELQRLKDLAATSNAQQIDALQLFRDAQAQGFTDQLDQITQLKDAVSIGLQGQVEALVAAQTAANTYRIEHQDQPVLIAPPVAPDVGQQQIVATLQEQNATLREQVAVFREQRDESRAQVKAVSKGNVALLAKFDVLIESMKDSARSTKSAVVSAVYNKRS